MNIDKQLVFFMIQLRVLILWTVIFF